MNAVELNPFNDCCLEPGKNCVLLKGHQSPCWPNLKHRHPDVLQKELDAARRWHNQWDTQQEWEDAVPTKFANVDIDKLGLPAEINAPLDNWIGRHENCKPHGPLILMGGVGAGKTTTACATARYTFNGGGHFKFVTAPDMLNSLKPGGGNDIGDYTTVSDLLIDDLGVEQLSDWALATLYTIIDARWRNDKCCIVTTNQTAQQLSESLGPRIYDRLRDNATAIVIPGPSRRQGSVAA